MPGVIRLRDQREALTRHTILRAARELFAERGYANTPVRLLAQRAGVALQTVYSTYGSKAGVLAGLPDLLDQETGIADLFDQRDAIEDPADLLRLLARITRQIRERGGDIVKILRSGAAVDADIAATMAEAHRRRRLGVEAVIAKIGLDKRAADIAVALMTDEICDSLVDADGWSYDEYEDWLATAMTNLLMQPQRRRHP
jgi:AcrR family transcriptional regulator